MLARLTPEAVVTSIVGLRLALHAGPVRLGAKLGLPASTVGAVLRREQLPRLAELDRITGELIRSVRHSGVRYQHREPGSLLHVDVKKLGRVPDGGGWRVHGREVTGPTHYRTSRGWDYVHVAVDDCTRPSPTPRSSRTSRPAPAPSFCTAPPHGSTAEAITSDGCSTTTR